ncbi:MAG: hypothetical protein ACRD34_01385, partial [Bryobacteraceae bacterium]
MARLDGSLCSAGMPELKTAEGKSLEPQMRALFLKNPLADASEQRRAGGVAQGGIVRAGQQFRRDQNF